MAGLGNLRLVFFKHYHVQAGPKPYNSWRGSCKLILASCCKVIFWPYQLVAIGKCNPGANRTNFLRYNIWPSLGPGWTYWLPPIGMVKISPYNRQLVCNCSDPFTNYKVWMYMIVFAKLKPWISQRGPHMNTLASCCLRPFQTCKLLEIRRFSLYTKKVERYLQSACM